MLCPTFVLVAKMQIFFSFLGMSSRNLVQILSFSRHMTKKMLKNSILSFNRGDINFRVDNK